MILFSQVKLQTSQTQSLEHNMCVAKPRINNGCTHYAEQGWRLDTSLMP